MAVTGRRAAPLAHTVQRIKQRGGAAQAACADVTDLGAMAGAVGEALDRFGRLDIVVANAGIYPGRKPMLEWYKDPAEVARLALFVAALPPRGPTGQVFSLAGRLL